MTPTNNSSRKARGKAAPKSANRELTRLLTLGLPIVAIALVAAFFVNRNQQAEMAQTAATAIADTAPGTSRLVYPDSPMLGPADAPVTLVEFLDPECEGCRAAYPVIKELLSEYNGQVRLVVRYVPRHNNSTLAAIATEAAGAQGQYWEMQELLFQNQPEWGEQTVSQEATFIRYAETLGLDMNQFRADLANPEFATKVERDAQDSIALGIQGTPTFFVNERLVTPLSYDTLKQMIDQALAN